MPITASGEHPPAPGLNHVWAPMLCRAGGVLLIIGFIGLHVMLTETGE